MSVINIVKNIKQIHPEYIALIKIGKFYYSYGKDAYIISYIFNYKIKKVEENVCVCAFPVSITNKIISKLEENKINYLLIDRRNNYEVDEKSNNKNLNKYDIFFEKAKKFINLKNRIDNIYDYLISNMENEKELIKQIENVINERRKI